MIDPFWPALAVKMVAAAAIVVSTSLLVERSGPVVGALIATLPVSAGPAYVFIAMEHGAAFVAESALTSLAINLATCTFIAAYAALAPRLPLPATLAAGFLMWIAAAALMLQSAWPFATLVVLNFSWIPTLALATRRLARNRSGKSLARQWWDIPLRALSVMILVAIVVLSARALGPRAAGLAALAPVVMTSLALVLHPRIGGLATSAVFASSLTPMLGVGIALMALHKSAVPLGATAGLTIGLAICMAWNLGLLAIHRRLARS